MKHLLNAWPHLKEIFKHLRVNSLVERAASFIHRVAELPGFGVSHAALHAKLRERTQSLHSRAV